MLFGGLEIRLHAGALYFAQGYYASMGFAVPAALGAQIGTGRRPLVLCGDGGFQMTGAGDLARARARAHADRAAREQRRLGDLPARHASAATCWRSRRGPTPSSRRRGAASASASRRRAELRDALRGANEVREFALIECRVPPTDISPVSRRYIRASARKGGASAQ